jgi:hypothetical protein
MLSSIFTDMKDALWLRDRLNRYMTGDKSKNWYVVVDRHGFVDVLTIGTALKLDFPIYVKG